MFASRPHRPQSRTSGSHSPGMRWCLLSLALFTLTLLTGCLSDRYKRAPKDTPPPTPIGLTATRAPVELTLETLIIYQGPGSWKANALWDEYVVSLHNVGDHSVTLNAPTLLDPTGQPESPGVSPRAVEEASLKAENRYARAGVAFLRAAAPGVAILGIGVVGVMATGFLSTTAVAVAGASLVAVPIYYVGAVGMHFAHKADIEKEFGRRRLVCPCTLAAGEKRTGSLFFPMTPSPRSLTFGVSDGAELGTLDLPLTALEGVHVNQVHVNRAATTPPAE